MEQEKKSSSILENSVVLCDIHDGIARVTLNRARASNTINLELAAQLAAVSLRCAQDPSVRVVLMSGSGDNFCAGGDLKAFAAEERLPAHLLEVTSQFHSAITTFAHMDAPLVAAVHGFVAGAGLALACAADVTIACRSAKFLFAYTKVGLSPDGGASHFLPRLIGRRRAMHLALTNDVLSAEDALRWGLVSEVVADDQLISRATQVSLRLAAGPTHAFGVTKRLLDGSWMQTLEEQLRMESRSIADLAGLPDGREGVASFIERRQPSFRGR